MRAHFLLATLTGVVLAIPANNTCLPAGATDSQGRYSCNPAHQYPDGQTCSLVHGCNFLCASGKPVNTGVASTATSVKPTRTPTCPAAGETDSKGRYSCNPAHQYPSGQACVAADGCYYLCGANGKPHSNNFPSAWPTQTATCAGPGSTDNKGRYSCNPAHQYPNSQTCVVVEGCYLLCGSNGKPVSNTAAPVAKPTQTATCPALGSTDSEGRYSCNAAHQYPNGQTCVIVDGCYYLSTNGQTIKTSPTGPPIKSAPSGNPVTHSRTDQPVVTAGAAHLQGSGILILVAAGLAL